ncbi:Uu.00g071180.m01.CDS01, partial [Anthostomella pinea]
MDPAYSSNPAAGPTNNNLIVAHRPDIAPEPTCGMHIFMLVTQPRCGPSAGLQLGSYMEEMS